jgi:hypothetical protein
MKLFIFTFFFLILATFPIQNPMGHGFTDSKFQFRVISAAIP